MDAAAFAILWRKIKPGNFQNYRTRHKRMSWRGRLVLILIVGVVGHLNRLQALQRPKLVRSSDR